MKTKKGKRISMTNMIPTLARCAKSGIVLRYHATGVGMHCVSNKLINCDFYEE